MNLPTSVYPLPRVVQAHYTELAAVYGCFILAPAAHQV